MHVHFVTAIGIRVPMYQFHFTFL